MTRIVSHVLFPAICAALLCLAQPCGATFAGLTDRYAVVLDPSTGRIRVVVVPLAICCSSDQFVDLATTRALALPPPFPATANLPALHGITVKHEDWETTDIGRFRRSLKSGLTVDCTSASLSRDIAEAFLFVQSMQQREFRVLARPSDLPFLKPYEEILNTPCAKNAVSTNFYWPDPMRTRSPLAVLAPREFTSDKTTVESIRNLGIRVAYTPGSETANGGRPELTVDISNATYCCDLDTAVNWIVFCALSQTWGLGAEPRPIIHIAEGSEKDARWARYQEVLNGKPWDHAACLQPEAQTAMRTIAPGSNPFRLAFVYAPCSGMESETAPIRATPHIVQEPSVVDLMVNGFPLFLIGCGNHSANELRQYAIGVRTTSPNTTKAARASLPTLRSPRRSKSVPSGPDTVEIDLSWSNTDLRESGRGYSLLLVRLYLSILLNAGETRPYITIKPRAGEEGFFQPYETLFNKPLRAGNRRLQLFPILAGRSVDDAARLDLWELTNGSYPDGCRKTETTATCVARISSVHRFAKAIADLGIRVSREITDTTVIDVTRVPSQAFKDGSVHEAVEALIFCVLEAGDHNLGYDLRIRSLPEQRGIWEPYEKALASTPKDATSP